VTASATPTVSLRDGLPVWTAIAAESFGGPAAQIGVLHRVIVAERKWITEEAFHRALSFCMLLPGPEAQQLATYVGWLLHGPWGAIVAGALFVLPGFFVLLALSCLYVVAGDTTIAQGILLGIRPAVVAILALALLRMMRRLKGSVLRVGIALGSFVFLFFGHVPFPIVLGAAALLGVRCLSDRESGSPPVPRAAAVTTLSAGAAWLAVWLVPLVVIIVTLGSNHVLAQQGRFFAGSALVTFGGAYAVLTYVAQEAVHRFHWLTPTEMVTGLGFAESTPGPLIQVVQFVAFLGAYRAAEPFSPLTAGIIASVLVTWLTFVPSFFFILGLGPFVERVAHNRWLLGALHGVSAAVLGAMLNLALWFALHTLFSEVRESTFGVLHVTMPALASVDWLAVALVLSGAVLLRRVTIKPPALLACAAMIGVVRVTL
jgi:chromate transporter